MLLWRDRPSFICHPIAVPMVRRAVELRERSPRPILRRSARPDARAHYEPFYAGNHPDIEFLGSLEGAADMQIFMARPARCFSGDAWRSLGRNGWAHRHSMPERPRRFQSDPAVSPGRQIRESCLIPPGECMMGDAASLGRRLVVAA